MLALRVNKVDPHEGHDHPPKKGKRVKGLWTVRIEPQQEAGDDMYYVWLYEGSQIMRKVYAALALVVIFAIVLYPLWPLFMRQGVYYLSWGFLMLLGLFFLMAIFRVILFCVTYFVLSPGLWLFPNLWEDVSFVDSFKPVWAWHEVSFISCDFLHPLSRFTSDLIHQIDREEEKEKVQGRHFRGFLQGGSGLRWRNWSASACFSHNDSNRNYGRHQPGREKRLYRAAGGGTRR